MTCTMYVITTVGHNTDKREINLPAAMNHVILLEDYL
jgi:hypothetical protein